jgi:hypothetical protein
LPGTQGATGSTGATGIGASGATGPTGSTGATGLITANVISVSSNYVLSGTVPNYTILLVDATAANITMNISSLPDSYVLTVKKVDITNHSIIFNVTIDGTPTPGISTPYESFTIVKYSSTYYLI